MKIMFAADMSFGFNDVFAGKEKVQAAMAEAAELFKKADFSMVNLENGPDSFTLELTGLKIGPVAYVGIPGEPFTEIGVRIKEAEGWKQVMPVCLTNGCSGYFPSKEAFAAGGYESRSSIFGPKVSDQIVDGCKELLNELK